MANNRLYLVNKETKETFLLAVSYGNGWYKKINGLFDFLNTDRDYNDSSDIIIGTENNEQFFETWIQPCNEKKPVSNGKE